MFRGGASRSSRSLTPCQAIRPATIANAASSSISSRPRRPRVNAGFTLPTLHRGPDGVQRCYDVQIMQCRRIHCSHLAYYFVHIGCTTRACSILKACRRWQSGINGAQPSGDTGRGSAGSFLAQAHRRRFLVGGLRRGEYHAPSVSSREPAMKSLPPCPKSIIRASTPPRSSARCTTADLLDRQGPHHRTTATGLQRGSGAARTHDRALDGNHAQLLPAGPQARLLPLHGIPHGPHAGQRHAEPVLRQAVSRGLRGHGASPRRHPRNGAGRGAGQRWPRAAGRLLPRLDGDHGIAGYGYGIRYEYGMFHQGIEEASRSSIRTTGCATAIRGNSRAPKCCTR